RGAAGRAYFLAGPVHTLEGALAIAQEITGIPPPRLRANPIVLQTASRFMAIVEKIIDLPPEYTAEGLRVVGGTTYIGSNERAKHELGWIPRPLHDGLAETLRVEMELLSNTRAGAPAR